jgi:hypothetical protein
VSSIAEKIDNKLEDITGIDSSKEKLTKKYGRLHSKQKPSLY